MFGAYRAAVRRTCSLRRTLRGAWRHAQRARGRMAPSSPGHHRIPNATGGGGLVPLGSLSDDHLPSPEQHVGEPRHRRRSGRLARTRSLAALDHDQRGKSPGNAPWRSRGPWSDAVPLGGLADWLRWRHPGSARGLCRCCCGPGQYPENPIRGPSCVHAATVQSPSSVPHPVAIRTSNGR